MVRNGFGVDYGTTTRDPVNNDTGPGDVYDSADVAGCNTGPRASLVDLNEGPRQETGEESNLKTFAPATSIDSSSFALRTPPIKVGRGTEDG